MTLFSLLVLIVAPLMEAGAAATPPPPQFISTCDLVKNPDLWNGQKVQLSGRMYVDLESTNISSPGCPWISLDYPDSTSGEFSPLTDILFHHGCRGTFGKIVEIEVEGIFEDLGTHSGHLGQVEKLLILRAEHLIRVQATSDEGHDPPLACDRK